VVKLKAEAAPHQHLSPSHTRSSVEKGRPTAALSSRPTTAAPCRTACTADLQKTRASLNSPAVLSEVWAVAAADLRCVIGIG
jgi:hypothetical protein